MLPNCPGEKHNNASRHKNNLLRLQEKGTEAEITVLGDSEQTSCGEGGQNSTDSSTGDICTGATQESTRRADLLAFEHGEAVLVLPACSAADTRSSEWVADTGATKSATFSSFGLYQEQPCRVRVTGVGGGFVVTRTGLLDIPVLLDNGQVDVVTISVLVHEDFPLQLLSLQDLITARGDFIFGTHTFKQANSLRHGEQGRIHGFKKQASKLYVLAQPGMDRNTSVVHDRHVANFPPSGDKGQTKQQEGKYPPPEVGKGSAAKSAVEPSTNSSLSSEQQRAHTSNFASVMGTSAIFKKALGPAVSGEARCLWCAVEAMLVAKTYSSAAPNAAHHNITLLHNKHGHQDFAKICEYYNIPVPKTMPPCYPCIRGKLHKASPTSSVELKATRRAEIFHADLRGPMPVMSKEGYWYIAVIVDDYTSKGHGFGLKSSDQWMDLWIVFVRRVESALGYKGCIKALRTDGASYFVSKLMEEHAALNGYVQHNSSRYAQWGNHTAERYTGTLGEMLLTILAQSAFTLDWWYTICRHAIATISASPRSKRVNTERGFVADRISFSPLECWNNKASPHQMEHIHPFGCQIFYVDPLATKLDFKGKEGVYTGVGETTGTANVMPLSLQGKELKTADYTVIENVFPLANASPASDLSPAVKRGLSTRFPQILSDDPAVPWMITNKAVRELGLKLGDEVSLLEVRKQLSTTRQRDRVPSQAAIMNIPDKDQPPEQKLDSLAIDPVDRVMYAVTTEISEVEATQERDSYQALSNHTTFMASSAEHALVMGEDDLELSAHEWARRTPKTIEQALRGPLAAHWLRSINRERDSLVKNGVLGPGQDTPPPDVDALNMELRFKNKYRDMGKIKISAMTAEALDKVLKTRAIVRGDRAKQGIHYNTTNAPTPAPDTVRAFLSLAVRANMDLAAGDIVTAFLNTPMEPRNVWVKSHSFLSSKEPIVSTTAPGKVAYHEMLKVIPGTPQASLLFYRDFAAFLVQEGFKASQADLCLFVRPPPLSAMVVLWVDDYIIGFHETSVYEKFIASLKLKFDLTEKRELTEFIGMKIKFERGKSLFISQEDILHSLLLKLGVPDKATSRTPGTPGFVHTKSDCPTVAERKQMVDEEKTQELYMTAVATINYAACWGRPDVTFKVNKLAKFMGNPGVKHWQELDKLLAYLNRTKAWGILFGSRPNEFNTGLHGYTDSSHNDCPDTSKATVGYLHRFFNDVISWSSKLHTYVTTSVNHSEYGALAKGTQRMTWLAALFTDLYKVLAPGHPFPPIKPVVVFTDNAGAISLAYGNVLHGSNQYVRNSYHYAKEAQEEGLVTFKWISTNAQRANLLTKGLTPQLHDIEVVSYVSPPPVAGCPLPSTDLPDKV